MLISANETDQLANEKFMIQKQMAINEALKMQNKTDAGANGYR